MANKSFEEAFSEEGIKGARNVFEKVAPEVTMALIKQLLETPEAKEKRTLELSETKADIELKRAKASRPPFGTGRPDDMEKDLIELSKVLGGDAGLFLRGRAPAMYESLIQMGEGLAQNIKKQKKFVSPEAPSQKNKQGAQATYKTKEEVVAAVKAGTIANDAAVKILKEKFGKK